MNDTDRKLPCRPQHNKGPRGVSLHFALLCLLSAATARAQTVPADAGPGESEVVVLSPFVVTSEKDEGYRATSTLAGTRIRTSLEDIGTSVSVYTSEFLKDTASNKMVDALVYSTGTEVSGYEGNIANYSVVGGSRVIAEPTPSNNPSTRVRGLASADLTRGYFRTVIPFDSYALDSIEVNRGSNAVLFGVGSPAGILNYNPKLASLSKSFGSTQVSIDNYGSLRETVDFNLAVLPKQISVRVAAVNDEQEYRQKPAFNHSKRLFGALTISPDALKKGIFSGTTLRGNFETGRIKATNPRNTPPQDTISSWVNPSPFLVENGAVRQPTHDATIPFVLNTSRSIGVAGFGVLTRGPIFVFENPGSGTALDSASGAVGRQWASSLLGAFPNGSLATAAMLTTTSYPQILPAAAGANLYYNPSVSDRSTFDYVNNLIDGSNRRETNKFKVSTINLEQLFFDNKVGVELAYDRQDNTLRNYSAVGTVIHVDANTRLIDGSNNPNFGRPFVSTAPSISYLRDEISTKRATAFAELDLKKHVDGMLGRVLGRHVLTLLAQQEESFNENRNGDLFYMPDTFAYGLNQNRFDTAGKRVFSVNYVGPSLYGLDSTAGINLQPVSGNIVDAMARQGAPGEFVVRRQAANQPFQRQDLTIRQTDADVVENASFALKSKRIIDSSAINLQSYWFDRNVITTFGLRKEKVEVSSVSAPINPGESNRLVTSSAYVLPGTPDQAIEDSLRSSSIVAKLPSKWLEWQKVASGFSLHASRSENFSPPVGVRVDSQGNFIPPPLGSTKELGFTVKLLGDRAILRTTWYETSQSGVNNASLTPLTARIIALHRLAYNAVRDGFAPDAGNHFPVSYVPPPQYLLDLFKVQVANGVLTFTDPGVVSTSDYVAKGVEAELSLNLTKNWTVMLNASRQEASRANSGASLATLLYDTELSNGRTIFEEWTNSSIPLFSQATAPGATQGFLSDNAASMFSTYNSTLFQDGGPTPELRKWRVNLVTRYKLDSLVKGLWVGGALRWQGKIAIGFPITTFNGSLISDVRAPIWGPDETTVDLSAGYKRPIMNDRYRLSLQVNVRNLFSDNGLVPVVSQPNGDVAAYRIEEPRRVILSCGFEF